ncbi:MAG: 3'-5' exonuclease [Sphingobacteriaceae bacterium]|nr:3'-5' exonuclease [Sphingobacteriaceae bacterium]
MFAIVDIETTGSKFPGNRIIDLAIIRHNGKEVVSEWHTLLRPDVAIPPFVVELTGISEEMVAEAPLFETVAVEVMAQLRDCVFVAHDVNFDYSFLRHELKELGHVLEMEKICTLKNSRKFLPGHPSYSLGKLCTSLGITVDQRHRAIGDARATAALFNLLYPFLMGFAEFLTDGTNEVQLSEIARTSKAKK